MTILGVKETIAGPLIRAVAAHGLDGDAVAHRFALAVWSGVAEPGDRLAGALVAALGPREALELVLAKAAPDALLTRLHEGGEDASVAEVTAALDRWAPRLATTTALAALRQAGRIGARLVVPGDEEWPVGLDDLGHHAPLALWVRGDSAALTTLSASIAIVGARAATGYGEHVTMEASAGLVDRGYTIVSGAAYGIDGMAHRAALASRGRTVAFLAGGVDRYYPSGHDGLLTRMVENGGAVVSEVPCGSAPTKWRFLQRNRLIAAAGLATVVVEAGRRSGSLNTAGHAAALGRPLGAVPGPVTSPASAGCHRLLRDFSAECVTTPDEMAELAPLDRGSGGVDVPIPGPSSEETRVLDALGQRARSVDDIAARAGLAPAIVRSTLGLLALDGRVAEREHGWVRRTRVST
ncbi:DNA-processing protein DprA [Desertivibrio insolitus]|uniref:DNA-processing protein DprA n=1 Tax=Herbiconiux sp. SYSU D00978 TaxID=2812562 RepID=UPI001A96B72C|nr:DNA-processing protein DprA [Herbiconiux sp. SYSU D00978]